MADLFLLSIVGIYCVLIALWLLAKYEDYSKKKKESRQEETELNNWLANDEVVLRNHHTYPGDWGMRRKYIAKRAKHICQICGRSGWLGFHVHHIRPLSKGGNNALENLTYLCKWCHENQHPHMIVERRLRNKKIEDIRNKSEWKRYWAKKRNPSRTGRYTST